MQHLFDLLREDRARRGSPTPPKPPTEGLRVRRSPSVAEWLGQETGHNALVAEWLGQETGHNAAETGHNAAETGHNAAKTGHNAAG